MAQAIGRECVKHPSLKSKMRPLRGPELEESEKKGGPRPGQAESHETYPCDLWVPRWAIEMG